VGKTEGRIVDLTDPKSARRVVGLRCSIHFRCCCLEGRLEVLKVALLAFTDFISEKGHT